MRLRLTLRRLQSQFTISAIIAAVALTTFACGLDKLTSSSDAAASLSAAVSGDSTVAVGGTATMSITTATGTLSSTDAAVVWSSDAPNVATVDAATGIVTGVATGTATISAKVVAPQLGEAAATAHQVRVKFAGIKITPVDSLIAFGMTKAIVVRGTNAAGAASTTIPFSSAMAVTSRDATIFDVDGTGALVAKANGSALLVVQFDGLKDSVSVKVRQLTRSISFPGASSNELAIQSIGKDRTFGAVAKDSLGNTIAAPAITWTSSDATTVSIGAATGIARGLKVGTANITATADGFGAPIVARVTQFPVTLSKVAGDGLSAIAGTPTSAAPQVAVLDSGSTPVPGVTVNFSVVSGGGSVAGGTQTTDAANGRAAPTNWTLGTVVGTNTLKAASGSLSTTFTATGTPGAAAKLGFSTPPASSTTAGQALQTFRVTVLDANDNAVTTATNSITIGIASGGGSASGNVTAPAVAGVATFSAVSLNTVGSYTLSATATGLTPATSGSISVSTATATQVVFTTAPTANLTDQAFTPVITAAVKDAFGNTVTTGAAASATITLSCTTTCTQSNNQVAASAGVATFPSYTVSDGGTYTFSVSAPGLTSSQTSTSVPVLPSTVATVNFASNIIGTAFINGGNIYYSDRTVLCCGGTIRQVSLTTGASITLASGGTTAAALYSDGTSVWFADSMTCGGCTSALRRVSVGVDHGTITSVVTGLSLIANGLMSDGTNLIFGAAFSGTAMYKVALTDGAGTTPTLMNTAGLTSSIYTVVGTTMYFYDGNENIKSVSTSGGAVTTVAVATGLPAPINMVVGGGRLWWTDGSTLYSVSATANSATPSTHPITMGARSRLGYDGSSLYIMDPTNGKLTKVNTTTFGTTTMSSAVNASTQVLVFDANYVYYVDNSTSMRLRRLLK